jgi:hypothetical protein
MFVATTNEPRIFFEYTPRPKDRSTKIVFIQVMRGFIDGVASLPSEQHKYHLGKTRDADTTARMFYLDYMGDDTDPYYNGDDISDGGRQGDATADPTVSATMQDRPDPLDRNYPPGKTTVRWDFRTAVYSAAGADAGAFYQYQDWTYEKVKGHRAKITLGRGGRDPGPDFKEALELWCKNRGFTLPTPPAAPPPAGPYPYGRTTYVVQMGDALPKIARAFYGNSNQWPRIYEANRAVIGPNPNLLFPGKRLVIPDLNYYDPGLLR